MRGDCSPTADGPDPDLPRRESVEVEPALIAAALARPRPPVSAHVAGTREAPRVAGGFQRQVEFVRTFRATPGKPLTQDRPKDPESIAERV